MTTVHPLLGWISGMCSDELPHHEIDAKVLEAKAAAHELEAEIERLRTIIGELYMARAGDRWDLYVRIKRAFRDSTLTAVPSERNLGTQGQEHEAGESGT